MSTRLLITLVATLALGLPGTARAHVIGDKTPPATIELILTIDAAAVTWDGHIPFGIYAKRVLGVATSAELNAMTSEARAERARAFFARENSVTIDGVVVQPTVSEKEIQIPTRIDGKEVTEADVMKFGAARLLATYETKGKPRRVAFVWKLYDPDGPRFVTFGPETVVAELRAFDERTLHPFTSAEPELIWHSSDAAPPPPDLTVKRERNVGDGRVSLPVASILLGLWAVVRLVAARRATDRGRAVIVSSALAVVAVAMAFTRVGWTSVPAPWSTALTRPDDADAVEIFKTLHKNIYRAFDHTDQSAIYDTLAQSVDGPLLESIYNDVYRSLILREEGGAVCRIQAVTVLEAGIVEGEPTDGEGFRVDCRWRVAGLVRHWGHAHERTKEFRAIFGVAPRAGAWKIVETKVLSEERVAGDEGTADTDPSSVPTAPTAPVNVPPKSSSGGDAR